MAEHGTNAGYAAHKREKEAACPACLEAHTFYMAFWRARNELGRKYILLPKGHERRRLIAMLL